MGPPLGPATHGDVKLVARPARPVQADIGDAPGRRAVTVVALRRPQGRVEEPGLTPRPRGQVTFLPVPPRPSPTPLPVERPAKPPRDVGHVEGVSLLGRRPFCRKVPPVGGNDPRQVGLVEVPRLLVVAEPTEPPRRHTVVARPVRPVTASVAAGLRQEEMVVRPVPVP